MDDEVKIAAAMDRWLETEDNLDKWHDQLSSKDRWILMTQWTGEAWSELKENKGFLKRLFEITGCLLTNILLLRVWRITTFKDMDTLMCR